ncbi:hypothetical protein BC938DRAFT_472226 [Jimgerdemannia flammicorona]|uniref:Uncharacterized protein n=1 Tax=Jimgerdemannia flammicorona TaxID=994334 RepID=A0A433Q6K5_9FUNG|nr:hypothetical protein BC938DRAFT_472226 [Jimgerdemannia flammicorona]
MYTCTHSILRRIPLLYHNKWNLVLAYLSNPAQFRFRLIRADHDACVYVRTASRLAWYDAFAHGPSDLRDEMT